MTPTSTQDPAAVKEVPGRLPAVFSVGYEGRQIEGLVELLSVHGITVLVDVRLNPISRKPGFSKTRLRDALSAAGIEYRHARALGNPKDNREPFRSGDTDRGLAVFRRLLSSRHAEDELEHLTELLVHERVALLCFERAHDRCHRQAVVDVMTSRHDHVQVVRLD